MVCTRLSVKAGAVLADGGGNEDCTASTKVVNGSGARSSPVFVELCIGSGLLSDSDRDREVS